MPTASPAETSAQLEGLIRTRVGGGLFVSVSNREPFVHSYGADNAIEVRAAVGGLTLALNAAMKAVGGIWVAHGAGDADRRTADNAGRIRVPPDCPSYLLQRVWLDPRQHEGYYNGFANQALWPLCHNAFTKPIFRDKHWQAYKQVNVKFAEAVVSVIGDRPAIIFIQDYHFALLPAMIRARCPHAICAHFWHIPWPLDDIFRICPWHYEILEGLLGNDLLGVHTPRYARRFLESATTLPGWERLDESTLAGEERRVRVKPFPISIDFDSIAAKAAGAECDAAVERLRKRYGLEGRFVVLGLDRIDYTKGVLERLLAVERLLEKHPTMRGRLVFVHAGAPSRMGIPAYRELHDAMQRLESRINGRYGDGGWRPVVTIAQQLHENEVLALYRLANICVVSSLDDGMNLVAKEFLAARNDEQGRLLLSEFTGAAWELPGAETFNPFATDRFADLLFTMSRTNVGQDGARMRRLRAHVRGHNIFGWIGRILEALPSPVRESS